MRRSALTQEHMASARMAANLLNMTWSAKGVNLWAVDLQTVSLVQGQATYSVPANTIIVLDAYVTVGTGTTATNRYLLPISRSEYATYPNPLQQGFPSVYWFDRLLSPSITLYQVPDGNEVSLSYYRMRQNQDIALQSATQLEMNPYFFEAFGIGLAWRLALRWSQDKPQLIEGLKALADETYQVAATQNVETAAFYITPVISGYWRV